VGDPIPAHVKAAAEAIRHHVGEMVVEQFTDEIIKADVNAPATQTIMMPTRKKRAHEIAERLAKVRENLSKGKKK
jgi:hypothetical protein